jgi:Family of unknown function (DUF6091)
MLMWPAHVKRIHWGVAVLLSASMSSAALAANQRVCVYDPLGVSGELYRELTDFRIELSKIGANVELKTYTNEAIATEDFRSGQCDGLMATALRTRQFNATTAALDSPGAASILRNGRIDMDASFDVVRRFVGLLSSPKATSLVRQGDYEVAGILPLGAAYAFVNDRKIKTLKDAAGKRVAAFENDKSQAQLIQRVGAVPVSVNITNFSTMFNNGNVDVIIAPAIVYKPFELYKGLGKNGAVTKFPIAILTYQLVVRHASFPKEFGQRSRSYFHKNFDRALSLVRRADNDIPEKYWVEPSPEENDAYTVMMRQGRVLMANKGYYDKPGLKLIKKIRCSIEPAAPECAERTETW